MTTRIDDGDPAQIGKEAGDTATIRLEERL